MPNTDNNDGDALEHARSQLGQALIELKSKGVLQDDVMEARPAWIMPFEFVIGQTRNSALDTTYLWVVGGNLPSDCIGGNVAKTAREAARHFALKWQLDAARLVEPEAARLVSCAEYLYSLTDEDARWR